MSGRELTYEHMNLRQLSELEYILLGDLRDVLEEDSTEENRKWLSMLVDALLRTLPREFILREEGGYLEEIVMNCPELDSSVQQLQEEHITLCSQLRSLATRLHGTTDFQVEADSLKRQLGAWMNCLQAHNRHEERLVQQAYQQDTGGGD
ncbi:MAG: hypothetical protein KDA76_07300 [Planctomycetaceae bacterium]|nr:hypothetical protein [Planctomycetaceae bacterium]